MNTPCNLLNQAHFIKELSPNTVLSRIGNDCNNKCEGECVVFVRNHLVPEDVIELKELDDYIVITSRPSSVSQFNLQKEIGPHIQVIDPFPNTTDYIFWENTLWIFASGNGKGYLWGALEITDINPDDIGVYLSKTKELFDCWKNEIDIYSHPNL